MKYIYQKDNNDDLANIKEERSFHLTPESIQIMPSAWLQEFKQAAAELNEAKLEELIQQIPDEHSQIIVPLRDLVTNFQFEKIFELI